MNKFITSLVITLLLFAPFNAVAIQDDYTIDNQTFPNFRADLNNNLGAAVTNNSGPVEPTVTFPFMWWADTTSGFLKQRNAANTSFIIVGTLAESNLGLLPLSGATLTGKVNIAQGINTASAATVNLSAVAGNIVHITGTTSIDIFTMSTGQIIDIIFDNILTLNFNVLTNKTLTGASVLTAAGDTARYYFDGTTVLMLNYTKTDGTALVVNAVVGGVNIESLQTNIALNFFLDSVDHTRSVLNMQDGYVDQFVDQLGVDTINSVNALYDVVNNLYTADKKTNSIMTGLAAPSGTVDAVSFTVTLEPWEAFDGDKVAASAGWATLAPATSGWLEYAFNNGLSAIAVDTYNLTSRSDVTQAPKDWTIEASNTGNFTGEEVILDTQTGQIFTTLETKNYSFSNSTNYIYYRIVITLNNGHATNVGIQELELLASSTFNLTLISETVIALTAPDSAQVSLFNQEVDTLTINTDILAWLSRSKQTFTATNATNILNATGHLLVDTDRVMVISSAADLPLGLDSETVYYVVTATANTLQLSLTSGGAAVTFSDNGTGTHSIIAVTQSTLTDQGDFATGKATISGSVDLTSQPSGTDMTLIVQTKNSKETKLLGQAIQY